MRKGAFRLLKREIVIINRLGLHARAAAKFVTLASGFDAEIRLLRSGREVNGKSIMGVMMLAAAQGPSWNCAPAARSRPGAGSSRKPDPAPLDEDE